MPLTCVADMKCVLNFRKWRSHADVTHLVHTNASTYVVVNDGNEPVKASGPPCIRGNVTEAFSAGEK